MTQHVRIALDVMGGDQGPAVAIPGAALALKQHPDLSFVLYGDESRIQPLLGAWPALAARSRVVHSAVSIGMDMKPGQALRQGRRISSLWMMLESLRRGEADAAVSAGNTGAMMAMAKFCLTMLAGIDRPALAAIWPTLRGRSIVLDVGASIGADAHHLVDLAIMGAAMAAIVLEDCPTPRVGLLNVGTEEIKGIEEVKAAARLLRETSLPHLAYHGFVEGDDLGKGTVDVVVTEGFSGNIALKTAEGTARQVGTWLRDAMGRNLRTKLGYLLARKAFAELKERMDPRRVNGAVFLGLDAIVIKSHGGTDDVGFAGAIGMARAMVRQQLLDTIHQSVALAREGQGRPTAGSDAPPALVAPEKE